MIQKEHELVKIGHTIYKLLPPDGGWGYVVALATTIVYISTVVPMVGFGLIYGNFLSTLGDETSGATLTNGLFNTVTFFTGLVANVLLHRYSYRKVALVGSILHFIGTLGAVFVTNLAQLIIFMGIFQGMGFGLLLPAAFSAFNVYFEKKLHLCMNISQTGMVVGSMVMPQIAAWSMQCFGFRSSLLLLVGLSLFTLPASLALQPVKWHMKKVPVDTPSYEIPYIEEYLSVESIHTLEDFKFNIEPLIEKSKDQSTVSVREFQKSRKKLTFIETLHMSMELLKDPRYLNISIGLALCFTSDIAFYPIIPLILGNIGFEASEIAIMMTAYFGADLVARIIMSVVSAFVRYKSRKLFYWGALLSAIFRTVWLLNNTFLWRISILVILGALRSLIETSVPLVVSEEYQDKFSSAYSLYMVANGIVCLIFGPLMSFVKDYTHSDEMVCHILTSLFLINVFTWTIEMFVCKKKKKKIDLSKNDVNILKAKDCV